MSLYLRGWVALVGVTAVANSVQCLLDNFFPSRRVYTSKPNQVSPLTGRLFGIWTLLAATIRLAFVITPNIMSLQVATLASFVIAFYHFATEVFVYKTAPIATGTALPLIISGLSILWMSLELLF